MSIEYDSGAYGDPSLREPEGLVRPWESINWPVKGVVINVIPSDSENNGQGQLLCDVRLVDDHTVLFNVAVCSTFFHQDTSSQAALARQTTEARIRAIYDGESFTPQVGSICLVMFIGPPGPNRDAAIMGFFPVSMQSLPHGGRGSDENIYPREAQAVTVFDESGAVTEEFRARLHPMENETPRWTRIQNGSALEIDNRGNINAQTTISRDRIVKERYAHYDYQTRKQVAPTPEPEGNFIVSTRGAKQGNIGLITGRIKVEQRQAELVYFEDGEQKTKTIIISEEVNESNEQGDVLVQTGFAGSGSVLIDTSDAGEGVVGIFTGKDQSDTAPDGRIIFETQDAADGSIIARTASEVGQIILEAAKNGDVVLQISSGVVRIADAGAMHPLVLGDKLVEYIDEQIRTHVHDGVFPGNASTEPPDMPSADILTDCAFVATSDELGSGIGSQRNSQQSSQDALDNADIVIANDDKVAQMAQAIMVHEGYFSGSRSQRNNNPGNLKYAGQSGATGKDAQGFAIFPNLQAGWNALEDQIRSAVSGNNPLYSPDMTIAEFFHRYAPLPGDNSVAYAQQVASALGVTPNTTLREALA